MFANLKLGIYASVFAAGIAVGAFGEGKRQDWFVHPQIIEATVIERDQICLARTKAAARDAQEAEAARQLDAANVALQAFTARAKERAFTNSEIIEHLQAENARYAKELDANGRSCPLDADTISWLRGQTIDP